ncbi:hypothetical protein [Agrobacterium vitis]|uniref:hypothetical protein n=1 Tax=Agrobacterium vitis TaxID=373 RepID=UPI003D29EF7E
MRKEICVWLRKGKLRGDAEFLSSLGSFRPLWLRWEKGNAKLDEIVTELSLDKVILKAGSVGHDECRDNFCNVTKVEAVLKTYFETGRSNQFCQLAFNLCVGG